MRTFALVAGLILLCGCSSLSSRVLPKTDLNGYKHVFVEHLLSDGRGIDEMIAADLRARGFDASAGPLTMMPADAQITIAYQDNWSWDFTTYMISLDLQVRESRTDKILATGHSYRPSMVFGAPPARMIHDLVSKVFKRG